MSGVTSKAEVAFKEDVRRTLALPRASTAFVAKKLPLLAVLQVLAKNEQLQGGGGGGLPGQQEQERYAVASEALVFGLDESILSLRLAATADGKAVVLGSVSAQRLLLSPPFAAFPQC